MRSGTRSSNLLSPFFFMAIVVQNDLIVWKAQTKIHSYFIWVKIYTIACRVISSLTKELIFNLLEIKELSFLIVQRDCKQITKHTVGRDWLSVSRQLNLHSTLLMLKVQIQKKHKNLYSLLGGAKFCFFTYLGKTVLHGFVHSSVYPPPSREILHG